MLDSSSYEVTIDAHCPNTLNSAVLQLNVTLMSEKAYFILVSGRPPRAKLVSHLLTAVLYLSSAESRCHRKDTSCLIQKLSKNKSRNCLIFPNCICILCDLSK